MYNFEKLKVWKESLSLIKRIYILSKEIDKSEKYNLVDQLKRSSTSIALNIAEGSGSYSDKEFVRFLYISRKSLYETIAILKLVDELYNKSLYRELSSQVTVVGKLLNGLINSLKTNDQRLSTKSRE